MLLIETPDTNDTFDTTTRAPLTPEQRDERVSVSVLGQIRDALLPPIPPSRLEYDERGWPIAPVVDVEARAAWHEADRQRAKASRDAFLAEKTIAEAAAAAAEAAEFGLGPSPVSRRPTAETAHEFKNRQAVTRLMRRGDLPVHHREHLSAADYERMGFELGDLDDDTIEIDLTFRAEADVEGDAEWKAANDARMEDAKVKREARTAKRRASAKKAADKKQEALVQAIADAKTDEEADEARARYEDHVQDKIKQAGKHQERKANIDMRHKKGFVHDGDRLVRGKRVLPFSEVFNGGLADDGEPLPKIVFRSHLAPALLRVNMCLPKKGSIWVGVDKTAVFRFYSKTMALDYPYIVINEKMLGLIAVDIDGSFESEEDLRQQLLRYLGPKQMPTMAVGSWNEHTGRFENPHLIWILDQPVLNAMRYKHTKIVDSYGPTGKLVQTDRTVYTGSKGCRKGPIRTYYSVQRGLVHLLLPVGADPGYYNVTKIKNPLSPYWSTLLLNEANYHSLKPFLAITYTDDAGKRRKFVGNPSEKLMSAAHKKAMQARNAGVSKEMSNLIWNSVGNWIGFELRFGEANSDPAYKKAAKSKASLYSFLVAKVTPQAIGEFGDADVVHDVVHMRCEFIAGLWEPDRPDMYNVGRDDGYEPVVDRSVPLKMTRNELKEGLSKENLAAKMSAMSDDEIAARLIQQHAAEVTAAGKEERSTDAVAREIMRREGLGLPLHVPTIIQAVSLGKSTVYRVWPKAVILAAKLSRSPTSYIVALGCRPDPESSSSSEGIHGQEQRADDGQAAFKFSWKADRAPRSPSTLKDPLVNRPISYRKAATLSSDEVEVQPDSLFSVRRRDPRGFVEAPVFEDSDAGVDAESSSEADGEDAGQPDGADWYDPVTGEVRERDADAMIYGEAPASDEPDGASLMDMLLASEGPSALDEAGDNVRKPEAGIVSEAQRRAALSDVYDRVDALAKLRW